MSILGEEVTIESDARTKRSSILCDENDSEIECTMASSIEDGRFVFPFNLPEGLGIGSVGIVEGRPELRFRASPHTPKITQEDIAAALRLAKEGERPEFFYVAIPLGHPFYGRQFKQYKPTWMRGTSFGDVLSEVDWEMKSLQIGAKSNDTKTEFCAWQKDSKLKGLATRFDFRCSKSGGSIIMSCTLVKVQKSNDELIFQGEPRMRINAESNMRYSKYISKKFNAVAYHDQPLFLKMRELVKLILAAEWLVEKGVMVDEDWMIKCTQPKISLKEGIKAIEEYGCTIDLVAASEPPSEMIPQPINFQPPNTNVAVNTEEAKLCRSLIKKGVRRRYGWYDRGLNEGVMFEEDGTPFLQQRSLKMVIKHKSSTNGKVTEKEFQRLHLALPSNTPLPPMSEFGYFTSKLFPAQSVQREITNCLGHFSANLNLKHRVSDQCVEMKISREFQPSRPATSLRVKETTTMKVSVDDFDSLYGDMDPNLPIRPEIPGKCEAVIPNVQSWSELYNETVPWPHTWQTPYIGVGEPVSSGGVSTRHIPVREETMKSRVVESETTWKDGYKRRGQELVARAVNVVTKAVYRLIRGSEEFSRIAGKFTSAWQKGVPPAIRQIFAVSNESQEGKWRAYRQGLCDQTIEEHFHGTKLSCNITASQVPCKDGNCGVCGISCSGLDRSCIRKNITFQRFGHGFYLAPHSSKCHDYTEGAYSYRAMLLCDVCPGNKYRLETNGPQLSGPPRGYDSVYGQVGSKLNYPEIVVYEPDAVIPRFIILYQKDGVAHPLAPRAS